MLQQQAYTAGASLSGPHLDDTFEDLPRKVTGLLKCYADLHLLVCRTNAIS
jgi:hypothetical protein